MSPIGSSVRAPAWLGRASALAALSLLVAALALYAGSHRYPLVFDDLQIPTPGTRMEFGEFALRWLSQASYALVYAIFGADLAWQRFANIVLHAAVGAVLFGFMARLFEAVLGDARARWIAFFGALAFVLHPVAVYGVAYLVQRSIVMATLFSLLCLWCVLEGLLRRAPAWHVAAVVAYLLALMSKEHAVMLPAVALAMAYLLRGHRIEALRQWRFGLFGFAAIAALAIYQTRHLIGMTYEPLASDIAGVDASLAFPLSVLNQGALFWRYLITWLVPWPGWMSVDLRVPFPSALFAWPHLPAFICYLAFPIAAFLLLRRSGVTGLLGFGLLYPWLLALTELAAVRVQEPFVLYRSYLWMSGLPPTVLLALSVRLPPPARHAVLAAVCLVLVMPARGRLETFSSPFALWDDAASKNVGVRAPYAERAFVNRGQLHLGAGRPEAAIADFEQAMRINPRQAEAYAGRATVNLIRGRPREAVADLDQAIALDPRHASAYAKRCLARVTGAVPAQDAFSASLADCEKATVLDPADHESWISLGILYRMLGRAAEAASAYRKALKLAPANASANFNYALLLYETGGGKGEVSQHLQAACEGGIAPACKALRR